MPRIWLTLPFLLLFILDTAAFAAQQAGKGPATEKEEKSYEIEVVVFENKLPELVGGEQWTPGRPAPIAGLEDAIEPGDAPETVPAAGGSLTPAVAALGRDPNYRILAHKLWVQTAEAKNDTTPVRIRGKIPGELDGAIKFYVSRFLHLEVDLFFRDENAPPAIAAADPGAAGAVPANEQFYELSETRRVKSKEVHYFDHPRFGAVVRISPLSN